MRIMIINGPNLNMLGKREEIHYGLFTLEQLNDKIVNKYCDVEFEFFQSNHEGDIIDCIQSIKSFDGLIINPGGYTHSSVSILDALMLLDIIKVEVHLSKISSRENFRSNSITCNGCDIMYEGEFEVSYFNGVDYILKST